MWGKEWGAYQKAKAVFELRESGLTAQAAAQSLGLNTRAATYCGGPISHSSKCRLMKNMVNTSNQSTTATSKRYSRRQALRSGLGGVMKTGDLQTMNTCVSSTVGCLVTSWTTAI